MRIVLSNSLILALVAGVAWHASAAPENTEPEPAQFAPPVRIEAGGSLLGAGRLYPSPALQDVDGDGNADIVVADLFGKVTFAAAVLAEDGSIAWDAEAPLQNREGKDLMFHNW